jgi:hypothetical protein
MGLRAAIMAQVRGGDVASLACALHDAGAVSGRSAWWLYRLLLEGVGADPPFSAGRGLGRSLGGPTRRRFAQ